MKRLAALAILAVLLIGGYAQAADQPNILWITSEDNGPELGCYGDKYAVSPNIDSIAEKGVKYMNAWSTAPVCAPARTTIITGVYPPSLGAQHMRSLVKFPSFMKMYPGFLREAGYYCTNCTKKDYNVTEPDGTWDDSSKNAHWRNRAEGQPFFAIFNFTVSHESQIRTRPHTLVHDPAGVRVPAYHPDTPTVRHDWAQYYDKITEMDAQVGKVLAQLKEDGLEDDTIIFYYGDHGSGMPRSKRWPYNSGLQVPMIVHVPEKYKDLAPEGYEVGGSLDRIVGFIDLAPTVLSLAGIEPPEYMQGHAFAGKYETPSPEYGFGFRGRMDERYDMVRTVRNDKYQYIRNFMPHKVFGQYIAYMFQTPTTNEWKQLYDEGKLEAPKTFFWETKAAEELYDIEADPDQVNNLADDPAYAEIKAELAKALQEQMIEIKDLGLLPEIEIHGRCTGGESPYEMGHDPAQFNAPRVLKAAEAASSLKMELTPAVAAMLGDEDSAVRYWGALGLLMRGEEAVSETKPQLLAALQDKAPAVRIAAAEALGRYGSDADAAKALDLLMAEASGKDLYVAMAALNAVDAMPVDRVASQAAEIEALPLKYDNAQGRPGGAYCKNLKTKILADIKAGAE